MVEVRDICFSYGKNAPDTLLGVSFDVPDGICTAILSGAKYTYLHCMLKEGNNYWICEFVCKHRSYDSLEKSMLQWADSITFDQQ